jgi:hypothetical protein
VDLLLTYSPDGKSLAILVDGSSAGIWNIATGKQESNARGGKGTKADHLAFTVDGQMVIGVGVGWF